LNVRIESGALSRFDAESEKSKHLNTRLTFYPAGTIEVPIANDSGVPGSILLPYPFALKNPFVQFTNFCTQRESYVGVCGHPIFFSQRCSSISKFKIYEIFIPLLCSYSALKAADTGMQYRQIHDFFHDLFYSICVSVKL
jgi:hypothetical protein